MTLQLKMKKVKILQKIHHKINNKLLYKKREIYISLFFIAKNHALSKKYNFKLLTRRD